MKLFSIILLIFVTPFLYAGTISYQANCKGSGFDLETRTIVWTGSFDAAETAIRMDAGSTNFKVINDGSNKVEVDLSSSHQIYFRQTEAGISFFGKYKNATLTGPNQTVYVAVIYQNVIPIYESLRHLKLGQKYFGDILKETEFSFQIFAEEDLNSTLSLRFKCDFSVL